MENHFYNGIVRGYDVSDPVQPVLVQSSELFGPRPVDIAGEEESAVSQGKLVAVATSSTNLPKPSSKRGSRARGRRK